MSQVFRNTGKAPYGLTYHGYDQKVTLYAVAAVSNSGSIAIGQLVHVHMTKNGYSATDDLTAGDDELFFRGAVIGFQKARSPRTPAARAVIETGDLLEVQIGGLVAAVSLPAAVASLADDDVLRATTSDPWSSRAAMSTTQLVHPAAYALVTDAHTTTSADMRFLGRLQRT